MSGRMKRMERHPVADALPAVLISVVPRRPAVLTVPATHPAAPRPIGGVVARALGASAACVGLLTWPLAALGAIASLLLLLGVARGLLAVVHAGSKAWFRQRGHAAIGRREVDRRRRDAGGHLDP